MANEDYDQALRDVVRGFGLTQYTEQDGTVDVARFANDVQAAIKADVSLLRLWSTVHYAVMQEA